MKIFILFLGLLSIIGCTMTIDDIHSMGDTKVTQESDAKADIKANAKVSSI